MVDSKQKGKRDVSLRELHLFAGIGGGILAGRLLGHTCVGAVEIDPYCRSVLAACQADGCLEPFPIHDDIRTFDGTAWRGRVDVVCGGFPCQPWSSAGKRLGTADPRHLWPEMARVVAEVRPRYVFAENVSMAAFREPWRDLRGLGYRVPPALRLGACDLGAVFHRHRWWLLAADAAIKPWWGAGLPREHRSMADAADAMQQRHEGGAWSRPDREARAEPKTDTADADEQQRDRLQARQPDAARRSPAHADGEGQPALAVDAEVAGAPDAGDSDGSRLAIRPSERSDACAQRAAAVGAAWWASPSRLLRLVSRHARRLESRRHRIHALGNAQVPLVAATAFRILMERL